MASSLRYLGFTYSGEYSSDGVWEGYATVRFSHTTPTDANYYNYKLKYWYFDQTAGETTSPDYWTSPPIACAPSAHSGEHDHDFTIPLALTAGHTYVFRAEIWYMPSPNGTWTASNLGPTDRQFIHVKAASEQSADISGFFRTGPAVTVENGEARYSGTWYQTSPGSVSWQFQVSVNSQYSNLVYSQTATLTQYGIRSIGGTTSASVGDVFWFHVEANGFDEYYSVTATGSDEPVGVYQWSWSNAGGSWNKEQGHATDAMLQDAYTAITTHGETTDFSHTVWNDMVDCVDFGMTDAGFGTNLSGCYMDSSDKVLTAGRFLTMVNHVNALADWIGSSRVNAQLSAVSRDEEVLGWYVTELMQKYNEGIDKTFPS